MLEEFKIRVLDGVDSVKFQRMMFDNGIYWKFHQDKKKPLYTNEPYLIVKHDTVLDRLVLVWTDEDVWYDYEAPEYKMTKDSKCLEEVYEIYGREEVEVYRQKLAEELHEKYTQAYPYPEGLQKDTIDEKEWYLGNLITLNLDGYPALGRFFIQIWEGDFVVARVYGDSEEEARSRANAMLAKLEES